MARSTDPGRPDRHDSPVRNRSRRTSGKFTGWIAVVAVVVIIGVPTALLFGAGDAVFDSPTDGIITFFGTLVGIAVLLAVGYLWEQAKEHRSRNRRR
ncbi:hypothetical protein GCM10009625_21330 [Brachybacterium fresconis]